MLLVGFVDALEGGVLDLDFDGVGDVVEFEGRGGGGEEVDGFAVEGFELLVGEEGGDVLVGEGQGEGGLELVEDGARVGDGDHLVTQNHLLGHREEVDLGLNIRFGHKEEQQKDALEHPHPIQ